MSRDVSSDLTVRVANLQRELERIRSRRVLQRDAQGRPYFVDGLTVGGTPLLPDILDTPGMPPNVATGAHGDRIFADVSWTASDGAASYLVVLTEVATGTIDVKTPSGTSVRFDWLQPNTSYSVTVAAVDALGRPSNPSPPMAFSSGQDTTDPSAVTGLTAIAGLTAITATWDESPDDDVANGRGWYEVELEWDTQSSGGWQPVDTVRVSATMVTFTGLAAETQHRVRVRAIDSSSNVGPWSSWYQTTTPADPTGTLEPGAVETIHLADGAVEAAKLANEAVVEAKLADAAVVSDKIASDAIVARTIAALAVETGHLGAASVTGEKIAAGTVQTRHLVVGSYDNVARNPGFEEGTLDPHHRVGAGWSLAGASEARSGQACARYALTNTSAFELHVNGPVDSTGLPVAPGEEFVASAWVRRGIDPASVIVFFQMTFRTESGGVAPGGGEQVISDPGDTWQRVQVSGTAPANAARVTVRFFCFPTQAGGELFIDDMFLRKRVEGAVLVDGAITARTLAAEELITTSAQIGSAVISDAHIANLSATKITAGEMSGARIQAGTLNANRLQAGTAIVEQLLIALGGAIQVPGPGQARLLLDGQGLRLFDTGGTQKVHLRASDGQAIFTGDVVGSSIESSEITGNSITGGVISGSTINGVTINGVTINSGDFWSRNEGSNAVGVRLFEGEVRLGHRSTPSAVLRAWGDDSLEINTINQIYIPFGYVSVGRLGGSQSDTANGVALINSGRVVAKANASNSGSFGRSGSAGPIVVFRGWAGQTSYGAVDLTSSGVNYSSASDYRLKTVVGPIGDALDRVRRLAPIRHTWLRDPDLEVDGFLAHQVAEIVPEAVSGEKDAVDDDGEIVVQGLDASRLMPLVVAAIQELDARLTAQEEAHV